MVAWSSVGKVDWSLNWSTSRITCSVMIICLPFTKDSITPTPSAHAQLHDAFLQKSLIRSLRMTGLEHRAWEILQLFKPTIMDLNSLCATGGSKKYPAILWESTNFNWSTIYLHQTSQVRTIKNLKLKFYFLKNSNFGQNVDFSQKILISIKLEWSRSKPSDFGWSNLRFRSKGDVSDQNKLFSVVFDQFRSDSGQTENPTIQILKPLITSLENTIKLAGNFCTPAKTPKKRHKNWSMLLVSCIPS